MAWKKGEPRPPNAGRKKGTPNRVTGLLRDQILQALDKEGGVAYLRDLARKEPSSFATLLGRVLPLQVTGSDGGPLAVTWASPNDSQ